MALQVFLLHVYLVHLLGITLLQFHRYLWRENIGVLRQSLIAR